MSATPIVHRLFVNGRGWSFLQINEPYQSRRTGEEPKERKLPRLSYPSV